MDEIDAKIMGMLKLDARVSNASIGKKVSLSEAAVRKRVINLLDSGAIKRFTIETPDDLKAVSALILVATDPSLLPTHALAGKMIDLPNIQHIYEITGDHDVAVMVTTPTMDGVNATLDEIRNIKHIKDTKTLVILKKWE